MVSVQALPQHSPDGAWWWTGDRWVPAQSADGNYRFDGLSWVKVKRGHSALTRGDWTLAAVWILALSAALVWSSQAVRLSGTTPSYVALKDPAAWVIAISVGLLLGAVGAWLGFRRRWAPLAYQAAYAWALVLFWWMATWMMVPNTDPNADIEAAASTAVIAIPALALVVAPLLTGATCGLLASRGWRRLPRGS